MADARSLETSQHNKGAQDIVGTASKNPAGPEMYSSKTESESKFPWRNRPSNSFPNDATAGVSACGKLDLQDLSGRSLSPCSFVEHSFLTEILAKNIFFVVNVT